MRALRLLLIPFSLLYAAVIRLRHCLYDRGCLSSSRGALPAIVVGNLSTGGTGKTPFTMFLTKRLLALGIRPAILSRGYRRLTSGFILASTGNGAQMLGDEPALMKRMLPDVPLAVCEDRLEGIRRLASCNPPADVVVLDDAFQHRRLRAQLSIVLMPWDQPWWYDLPLPAGNLRDIRRSARRAQAIVVTRCPAEIREEDKSAFRSRINPQPGQSVFFASVRYGTPTDLEGKPVELSPDTPILGFCGIAAPEPFRDFLASAFALKKFKSYPDHHGFTASDLQSLGTELATFATPTARLVTTAKDAERLLLLKGPWRERICIIPIETYLADGEDDFNRLISQAAGH